MSIQEDKVVSAGVDKNASEFKISIQESQKACNLWTKKFNLIYYYQEKAANPASPIRRTI